MTPSQKAAIEKQKEFAQRLFTNCVFTVYTSCNANQLVLLCEYTLPNMLGSTMQIFTSWTIGKRGGITRRGRSK